MAFLRVNSLEKIQATVMVFRGVNYVVKIGDHQVALAFCVVATLLSSLYVCVLFKTRDMW